MVLYPGPWVLALLLCCLTDVRGLGNYGTIDFSRYCGSGHFAVAHHAGYIRYAPETAESSVPQSCILRLNPPVGAIGFYLQFDNLTLDCSYQTLKVYDRTKMYVENEPGTVLVDFCSENAENVTEITSSEKSIGIEFYSNPTQDNLDNKPAGFRIMYTVFSGSIEGLGLCPLEHFSPGFMQPQFKCANGRCIHAELECDGNNNCGDSSDESDLDHETNCDGLKDPPGNRTDLPHGQASEDPRPNFPTTLSAHGHEEATYGGYGLSNGAIVAIVIIAFVSFGIIIFAAAVRYSRFRNKFQGGATQRSIDYEYTESPAYESSERVARLVIRDGRAIITRGYIPTHSVGGSTSGTDDQASSAQALNGDCSNAANPQANGHVVLPARSDKPSLQPLLGDRKGSDSDGALLPAYPPPPYADLYPQVYDRTLDSSAV